MRFLMWINKAKGKFRSLSLRSIKIRQLSFQKVKDHDNSCMTCLGKGMKTKAAEWVQEAEWSNFLSQRNKSGKDMSLEMLHESCSHHVWVLVSYMLASTESGFSIAFLTTSHPYCVLGYSLLVHLRSFALLPHPLPGHKAQIFALRKLSLLSLAFKLGLK